MLLHNITTPDDDALASSCELNVVLLVWLLLLSCVIHSVLCCLMTCPACDMQRTWCANERTPLMSARLPPSRTSLMTMQRV